ncbi:MAG TPA: flagellar biosynthetic protein FliR [Pirellulales bacterium]|nr:flagellar biosynthetic protein FliR [Pirellulales bacterium]
MPALDTTPFIVFTFVLARVSGLVMTAPLFGSEQVPAQVRGLLAFALALMITPVQLAAPPAMPANLAFYALPLAGELLVGVLLGLGVKILLSGVQVAGQIISQMSGLSLAEVFNPDFDAEVPAIANMLHLVTLAVFAVIGGHRLLVGALLDTYRFLPVGHVMLPPALGSLTTSLLAESFSLAVRGAAPAIVALMLATIVLGLISRTLPQLNVLAVGFGLNALASFAVLAVSIGAIAWLFQEQLEPAVQAIVDSLRPAT